MHFHYYQSTHVHNVSNDPISLFYVLHLVQLIVAAIPKMNCVSLSCSFYAVIS